MKVHVRFIELADRLKTLVDLENFEADMLPLTGDSVWLPSKDSIRRQYRVIERHWNIGNMIGMIEIFVSELHPRSI